jgi:hypothetical protein
VGLLLVSTPSVYAQESAAVEKIRDVSPDGKFARRVSCNGEPASPNQINPDLITASRTRFAAVENRQASNYVKEKHPIKRTIHL